MKTVPHRRLPDRYRDSSVGSKLPGVLGAVL